MLRNADGGGGCQIFREKRYERIRFNVISVTMGWVGVQFPGKKRYVTLEWPLIACSRDKRHSVKQFLEPSDNMLTTSIIWSSLRENMQDGRCCSYKAQMPTTSSLIQCSGRNQRDYQRAGHC